MLSYKLYETWISDNDQPEVITQRRSYWEKDKKHNRKEEKLEQRNEENTGNSCQDHTSVHNKEITAETRRKPRIQL